VARLGGGGVCRWMAQRVFIRTFFMLGKNGGDGSVLGKVRVSEFPTGEIRTRSETLRGRPAARRDSHFAGKCVALAFWAGGGKRSYSAVAPKRGMKMMGAEESEVRPAAFSCSGLNWDIWRSMGIKPARVLMKLSGFASTITVPSECRRSPKVHHLIITC
jgi:hypothetical protein